MTATAADACRAWACLVWLACMARQAPHTDNHASLSAFEVVVGDPGLPV
jgi:hypothetical protein